MAYNPKYKINILDVFKRAYASEERELRDRLRPLLINDGLKFFYANLVRDEIIKRTTSGIDKNNRSMGNYKSDGYKESLEFKIYKGGKRRVDLKLTGSMLSDIDNRNTRYTITFNFGDQDNRDKAQGHITGRYGKHGRTSPRDFFGLPEKEEEDLLRTAIQTQRAADPEELDALFENLLAANVLATTVGDDDAG